MSVTEAQVDTTGNDGVVGGVAGLDQAGTREVKGGHTVIKVKGS